MEDFAAVRVAVPREEPLHQSKVLPVRGPDVLKHRPIRTEHAPVRAKHT